MEGKKNTKQRNIIIIVYVVLAVGLFGYLIKDVRSLMFELTPYALLLLGVIVISFSLKEIKSNFLLWCIITYAVTFIIELVGVKTGLIFGHYNYGNTLGPKLFNVPLIIGFNWVIIILGAVSISQVLSNNIYFSSFLAASLTVSFDLFLEPVAITLNYWSWQKGIIPLQNYIAWFIITFVAAYFLNKIKIKAQLPVLYNYFLAQTVFFLTLNVLI